MPKRYVVHDGVRLEHFAQALPNNLCILFGEALTRSTAY